MTFQLENYLLKNNLVTKEVLETASSEKGRSRIPLIEALDFLKFIDKKALISKLEQHFHTKYVDLISYELPPEVVRIIPEGLMKRYLAIAISLDKKKNKLSVAMVDPFDVVAIDSIRAATGYEIEPFFTTEDEFHLTFEKFYLEIFAEKIVGEVKLETPEELLKEDIFTKISEDNKETLIIRLFDTILTQAIRTRATDIHIEPQARELLIRYRIDGILQTVQILPKRIQPLLGTRVKILSELDIAESRHPQDGRFRVRASGHDLDLRVSTIPGLYGEKFAIRVLEKSSFAFGLSQLGMSPEMQAKYEDYIFRPSGLILVTGPTGSGKTTTLYSTLSRIRSPEKNILTIEDPIEYELLSESTREGGISQVQVNPKIDLTFAAGMRAFLRQDPDIIMVGEIRDRETAEIGITASLIGRLVLTTMHTNNTISSITRLLNMGIEPYMIAHSLICVIAQRLLRTLCPYCKESYEASKVLLERFGVKDKPASLFRGVGCPKCRQTGFIGRTGAYELLPITENLRDLIMQNASASEILDFSRKEGFKTVEENAISLILNGTTSVSEMLRVIPSSS